MSKLFVLTAAITLSQLPDKCLARPPHLNINRLEIMPVTQSVAGFQVYRG